MAPQTVSFVVAVVPAGLSSATGEGEMFWTEAKIRRVTQLGSPPTQPDGFGMFEVSLRVDVEAKLLDILRGDDTRGHRAFLDLMIQGLVAEAAAVRYTETFELTADGWRCPSYRKRLVAWSLHQATMTGK